MKITYYANAMVLLEGQKTRVLCDPWVTFNNFSATNIYNFPKCDVTKKEIQNIKPDFLYITHTHVDHFDPITLSLFNKETPVLVADYKVNFTAKNIASLGFKNIKIIPKEGLSLNKFGDHVWMEASVEAPDVDSIALFKLDNFRILNANDNIFNFKQCIKFRKLLNGLDVALLPSGAHGPWPMFFDEVTEKKLMWARQRKKRLLENFRKYVNATKPKWVVPISAGLMCSGKRAKQYKKFSGISPRSEVIKYALKYEKFIPIPLSNKVSYDFKKEKYNGKYQEATFDNQKKYIDELTKIPDKFSKEGLFFIDKTQHIFDLSQLLTTARKKQIKWQKKLGFSSLNHTIFFDVGQNCLYKLCFKNDFVERIDKKEKIKEKKFEIFKMSYELLLGIITKHFFWDNINTNHVYFKRKNCQMNRDILNLMNYFNV